MAYSAEAVLQTTSHSPSPRTSVVPVGFVKLQHFSSFLDERVDAVLLVRLPETRNRQLGGNEHVGGHRHVLGVVRFPCRKRLGDSVKQGIDVIDLVPLVEKGELENLVADLLGRERVHNRLSVGSAGNYPPSYPSQAMDSGATIVKSIRIRE